MSPKSHNANLEVGPIRPPSEASSLLVRVTRNCPWNKCLFCPVYKKEKFSKRTEDEVIADIDALALAADNVRKIVGLGPEANEISSQALMSILQSPAVSYEEQRIAMWMHTGSKHVFLQDADSLAIPSHRVAKILRHLYLRFPSISRVTSYARTRTLCAKTPEQMAELRAAGLTRIHVGFESGADEVLELAQKGLKAEHHIKGCRLAIDAGFQVCCYVMPGLGGRKFTEIHARKSAEVLKEINPQHVRLRTTWLARNTPMYALIETGELVLLEEEEVVAEIQRMLRGLKGADSRIVSDHEFNLLMEIEGHVTEDADKLDAVCQSFLDLPQDLRDGYVAARRAGYFRSVGVFLSQPEETQAGFVTLAGKLKNLGGGSLLKGMMSELNPRLI